MKKRTAYWLEQGSFDCACGMRHSTQLRELILQPGALGRIPELVRRYGGTKVFLLADGNEYRAAGEAVCGILAGAGIPYTCCVLPQSRPEPDEGSVGSAAMYFDRDCDLILCVGSGVVNDVGKILAALTGRTYFIAATAPSMDGYASSTSSMVRDGLKVSLSTVCPAVIIADLDVLCQAPAYLLQSGLGDMAAKYISLCEWRLARLLVDEPYCPTVERMVRDAVELCMDNAGGLASREPDAVAAVMEGLVLTGMAMSYMGISRPASGMEHYFSHIWDMRGLEFGAPTQTHGIQCGVATLLSIKVYEQILKLIPDEKTALAHAAAFDLEDWNRQLSAFLGKGARAMIQGEQREGKYDPARHALRLKRILSHWDEVRSIITETIPPYEKVARALEAAGAPTLPGQIGLRPEEVRTAFLMTKDIRDKYIASRLLWDLGAIEGVADSGVFG